MPAMDCARPTDRSFSSRERLLAWLVCGLFASGAHAQTGAGVDPAAGTTEPPAATTPPPAPVAQVSDAVAEQSVEGDAAQPEEPAPTDGASPQETELVAAAPVDPVAASEKLLQSNIAEFGSRSLQTAEAYIDLAHAQR